jgi:hypothetical protein
MPTKIVITGEMTKAQNVITIGKGTLLGAVLPAKSISHGAKEITSRVPSLRSRLPIAWSVEFILFLRD